MVDSFFKGIVDNAAHALGHPGLAAITGGGGGSSSGGIADARPPMTASMLPSQQVSMLAGQDPRIGVIADAEDALGHVEDGNPLEDGHVNALQKFSSVFGHSALGRLHENVKSGMSMRPRRGRLVTGPGTPKSDSIPAVVDGSQRANLSTGEFVIPNESVVGAGNGDPVLGAKRLQDLSDQLGQMHPTKAVRVEHVGD